jgi:hypothetical protein
MVMKRKILVILFNRWNRNQKPVYLELDCDAEGNIHKQRPLRAAPKEARYHEVWENDEGRTEFASCFRFKRKYGHKLEKPKAVAKPKSKPR